MHHIGIDCGPEALIDATKHLGEMAIISSQDDNLRTGGHTGKGRAKSAVDDKERHQDGTKDTGNLGTEFDTNRRAVLDNLDGEGAVVGEDGEQVKQYDGCHRDPDGQGQGDTRISKITGNNIQIVPTVETEETMSQSRRIRTNAPVSPGKRIRQISNEIRTVHKHQMVETGEDHETEGKNLPIRHDSLDLEAGLGADGGGEGDEGAGEKGNSFDEPIVEASSGRLTPGDVADEHDHVFCHGNGHHCDSSGLKEKDRSPVKDKSGPRAESLLQVLSFTATPRNQRSKFGIAQCTSK